MNVAIVIGVVLLLMLLGARLFVVVGVATLLSFVLIVGEGLDPGKLVRIVNKMEGLTTKNVFLSIPLFVAAGTVMTRGGMAGRLIDVVRCVVGRVPGGLAIAAVVSSMFFAAISGSSPVTLVAVGTILYPALVKTQYPRGEAMGLLMTAGSLGCLLPPSIAMLIYSISVSGSGAVDPSDLFIAGGIPAVAIAGLLSVYAFWIGKRHPESQVKDALPPGEFTRTLKRAGFAFALPVVVVGGIYTGQFTPTEAGAVALGYSVIVCTLIHRELDLKGLYDAATETAVLVGSLILIVVLAFGLNDFLAEMEAADRMGSWLRSAGLSPLMFFLVVNIALIFIGALMDSVSATLVFAPLLAPIAIEYGIDPIHFGVVFVVNMEIGYLMPPVATNLFVGAAIFRRPFGEVARAVLPTLAIVVAALGLLILVPTLSKGVLNARDGVAIWQPFPWNGKESAVVVVEPASDPVDAGPKKSLTMEEMMKAADAAANAAVDAGVVLTPKKAMTMEEMMKAADAANANKDGANDVVDAGTTP
ncbi:MAG: TRAP transporter large permease [Deltaproteobacteria bacterium]|nr:TRAP transporter large permease [Deltaproteobacteria bacterium]